MSHLPRSNPGSPSFDRSSYGVYHEVIPDTQLMEFVTRFRSISDSVFKIADDDVGPPVVEPGVQQRFVAGDIFSDKDAEPEKVETPQSHYDPRHYYKVYDPERFAVPILDVWPSDKGMKSIGAVFERQDFGSVQQNIRNQTEGRVVLGKPLPLIFDRVSSVGRLIPNQRGNRGAAPRQKLALMADTSMTGALYEGTIDRLNSEFEFISREIVKRLMHPVSPIDFIIHSTFTHFKQPAQLSQVAEIVGQTNESLKAEPLSVEIEPRLIFKVGSRRKR